MRFWFDTEFYENGRTIDLISIGIIAESGRSYYAETLEAETTASRSPWLIENVRPQLVGSPRKFDYQIAKDIVEFMGDKPEIWAYYADYDWVVLCQLYGRMIDLPKGWPMYCRDVTQWCDMLGNPALPKQVEKEHNALADAMWTRSAWLFLQSIETRRNG